MVPSTRRPAGPAVECRKEGRELWNSDGLRPYVHVWGGDCWAEAMNLVDPFFARTPRLLLVWRWDYLRRVLVGLGGRQCSTEEHEDLGHTGMAELTLSVLLYPRGIFYTESNNHVVVAVVIIIISHHFRRFSLWLESPRLCCLRAPNGKISSSPFIHASCLPVPRNPSLPRTDPSSAVLCSHEISISVVMMMAFSGSGISLPLEPVLQRGGGSSLPSELVRE